MDPTSSLDPRSAWREQLSKANPRFRLKLLLRERELFPRFAEHYEKLRALPRQMRRTLQRKLNQSLAGVALLLTLGPASALAATINVGGDCALIEAIRSADSNTSVDGCTAGVGGPDTIVLPANSEHILTQVQDTQYGPTGLPPIASDITIEGNGSTISRSDAAGTPEFRIFSVTYTGRLTLRDTTVSGGMATGDEMLNSGGGGVLNHDGTVTLVNSTITNNSAAFGGGIFTFDDAATASSQNGVLNIIDSTVSGNTATRFGGGIENAGGVVNGTNCTISGNAATGDVNGSAAGGGLLNAPGGVYDAGFAVLTNCTVSGNSAELGGGIFDSFRAASTLYNTTVTRNLATQSGGGIFNLSKAALDLNQSLISGNTAPDSPEIYNSPGNYYDAPGVVGADNFNIFGRDGNAGVLGFTPGVNDIVPTESLDEILDTRLRDNGGPTLTHALVKGSPAVDAIPTTNCPPPDKDQRGYSRPVDADFDQVAECDVGSFERIPEISSCQGRGLTKGCTVNGIADQLCLGTSGNDTVEGTSGADVITGSFGNDVINGGGGDDMICGGLGDDILNGGDGNDRLFGQEGRDILRGDNGDDALQGGGEADTCQGNNGADSAANCEIVAGVP